MNGGYVRTASGRDVTLRAPRPQDINFRDVAQHLAQLNRFRGATAAPYSVAQHSVHVAHILESRDQSPVACLCGLLHDAHEAYLGDFPAPVKALLAEAGIGLIDSLEMLLDDAIHMAAGLGGQYHQLKAHAEAVKQADMIAFATEWRDFMTGPIPSPFRQIEPRPVRLKPVNWTLAEQQWLACFDRFTMLAAVQPMEGAR